MPNNSLIAIRNNVAELLNTYTGNKAETGYYIAQSETDYDVSEISIQFGDFTINVSVFPTQSD